MGIFDLISGKDARHAHAAMVFAVANSDGHLDESEAAWCAMVSVKLGLNDSDVRKVIEMGGDEAAKHIFSMSKADKAVVLADCIRCSVIDGQVHPSELEGLNLYAQVMEFNESDAQLIAENIDKDDDVLRSMF